MTEIYLIRHTQAEGNIYRMMQGHWNGKITRQGADEIELLAKRFENVHVDAVYSSDLDRAYLTAQAVSRHENLPIVTRYNLREIDVGPLESEFFGNLIWRDPENSREFMYDSDKWFLEGAETFAHVKERAYDELKKIAECHDGQTIAVVSHGITIRCLLSKIHGVPLTDIEHCPICKNTAVSKLNYKNGSFECEYLNDFSHLGKLGDYHWWHTADLRDVEKKEDGMTVFELYDQDKPAGRVIVDEENGCLAEIEMCPEYNNGGYLAQARGRAIKRLRKLGFDTEKIEEMNYD